MVTQAIVEQFWYIVGRDSGSWLVNKRIKNE
jgi:hypothetical protein